jgi:hypothetical protein
VPFTAAHPLAVLPLVRLRKLDASCLVIGSIAPDFEYFLHGEERGTFAHTLLGAAIWVLPMTIVLALVFHAAVKRPLVAIAPRAIARHLDDAWLGRWPHDRSAGSIAAIVAAAALGVFTHLAWDAITHARGWGPRLYPELFRRGVDVPLVGPMLLYRVVWCISTAIGLAGVTWYVVRVLRRVPPVERAAAPVGVRLAFAACVVVCIALTTARAVVWLHARDAGTLAVAPISGLLAGTLIASIVWQLRARERLLRAT